jgi:hypothetical protein
VFCVAPGPVEAQYPYFHCVCPQWKRGCGRVSLSLPAASPRRLIARNRLISDQQPSAVARSPYGPLGTVTVSVTTTVVVS